MDLSELSVSSEASDMPLVHPGTGEVLVDEKGVPVTLKVISTDNEAYKKVERKIQNKRLKDRSLVRNNKINITMDQIEEETTLRAVTCIVGWSSNLELGGKKLVYSPASAERLIRELSWVREQVEEYATDRANFILKSDSGSKSSQNGTSS